MYCIINGKVGVYIQNKNFYYTDAETLKTTYLNEKFADINLSDSSISFGGIQDD